MSDLITCPTSQPTVAFLLGGRRGAVGGGRAGATDLPKKYGRKKFYLIFWTPLALSLRE
jgi:hypothetical protein